MGIDTNKPPKAQSWALWAALAGYITFLGIYLLGRDIPYIQVRTDGAAWGQFGDYVGGVINPIVGLITIWLLTASLKQSQKEMALTRKALEDAEASQKATEAALRDQLKVSEHARDMTNATALCTYYADQCKILDENHMNGRVPAGEIMKSFKVREQYIYKAAELGNILDQEHHRLRTRYLTDESNID